MFHDYVFAWWQMAIFKFCLITLGVLIGANWSAVFKKKAVWQTIMTLFVLTAIYMAFIAIQKI